jgi:aryl-alcohol dehydrogenase-like predicted oxidoreductase
MPQAVHGLSQPTGRSLVVMDMGRLGNSALTVSVTGLGGNNLGRAGTATETAAGAAATVNAAVDAGITLFDTADC